MAHRQFAERLNRELDNIGVPPHHQERVVIFSKLVHLPKIKAEAILHGVMLPNDAVLEQLARELEVNAAWLLGKSNHRQRDEEH